MVDPKKRSARKQTNRRKGNQSAHTLSHMAAPGVEEQRSEAKRLMETPLAVGQEWCLVSERWWQVFKEFTGLDEGSEPSRSFAVKGGVSVCRDVYCAAWFPC